MWLSLALSFLAPQLPQRVEAPAPPAPIVGRVVDARTGESLADYEFYLSSKSARRLHRTDGDGRFRADPPGSGSRFRAKEGPNEHRGRRGAGELKQWFRWPPKDGSGEIELRVTLGHRYEFAGPWPEGLEPADFQLHRSTRPVTKFAVRSFGRLMPTEGGAKARGSVAWVREHQSIRSEPPETAYLATDDGYWIGHARTARADDDRHAPESERRTPPRQVEFEATGVVEVTLESEPTGAPWEEHLALEAEYWRWFAAEREGDESAAQRADELAHTVFGRQVPVPEHTLTWHRVGGGEPHTVRLGHDGPHFVGWLTPGRWKVDVRSGFFAPRSVQVDVVAGETRPLTVDLGRPVSVGTVRVVVEDLAPPEPSDIDRYKRRNVSASIESDAGARYSALTWSDCGTGIDAWFEAVERDGRRFFEVAFEGVPEGDYELSLRCRNHFVAPARTTVSTGETANAAVHPAPPAGAYGFRVYTTEGESYFQPTVLGLDPTVPSPFSPALRVGASTLYALSLPGVEGRWCAKRDGYRRVYGDRSDFALGEDGHRWARIDLVPGWSVRLRVRDPDGAPLAGVLLEVSGETLVTDDRGCALLELDARPEPLRLDLGGWATVAGDVDADGRLDDSHAEVRLVLGRAR